LIGSGNHLPGKFSRFPDRDAGELKAGGEDWCEEKSASFETDYAGDFGEVMGGSYVRFQVGNYSFCCCWVPKDREDVGKELILLLC
jgi:hypothetical protein